MSLFVQKYKVHGPGVDAHALRVDTQSFTFSHSSLDFLKKPIEIPAQGTVHHFHSIGKTVDFPKFHLSILHPPQDMAAAGRPYIHRKIITVHCPTSSL